MLPLDPARRHRGCNWLSIVSPLSHERRSGGEVAYITQYASLRGSKVVTEMVCSVLCRP